MTTILNIIDSLTQNLPEYARAGIRRLTVAAVWFIGAWAAANAANLPDWVAPLAASLGQGTDKARRARKG